MRYRTAKIGRQWDWLGVVAFCLIAVVIKLAVFRSRDLLTWDATVRDVAWSGLGFYVWMSAQRRLSKKFPSWVWVEQTAIFWFILVFISTVSLSLELPKETSYLMWAFWASGTFGATYMLPIWFLLR